ncbi:ricin-type beta-trefoil lectin domain protein [Micromonospora sp. NPDC003197]
MAAVLVVIAGTTTAVAATTSDGDDSGPLAGVVVPAEYRQTIVKAAGSCLALSPARLAAQLMEESRFGLGGATSGDGRGLAGLSDEEWNAWHPWPGAERLDPKANITALAHYLCDMVGQARVAQDKGEPWRLALAGHHSGRAAVKAARGMPKAADNYVNRVARYAAWYELQPYFDGVPATPDGGSSSAPATTAPTPTPTPTPTASATPSPQAPTTRPAVKPTQTTASPPRTVPTPTKSTTPPRPGFDLVNDEYNGCVSAVRALDGTHLRVVKCDGSAVQRWETRSDGTIRSVGLCMDVANASTDTWTPVQVAWCSGNPAQQFRINSKKQVYSPYANKCINIHIINGQNTVLMHPCLNQGNQYFRQRR